MLKTNWVSISSFLTVSKFADPRIMNSMKMHGLRGHLHRMEVRCRSINSWWDYRDCIRFVNTSGQQILVHFSGVRWINKYINLHRRKCNKSVNRSDAAQCRIFSFFFSFFFFFWLVFMHRDRMFRLLRHNIFFFLTNIDLFNQCNYFSSPLLSIVLQCLYNNNICRLRIFFHHYLSK